MAVKKGDKPKQGKVLPPKDQSPTNISKTEILTIIAEFHDTTRFNFGGV